MISISKDDLWKGAIEDFIGPFIEYFYPDYVHLIDWTRPIQFLDTELSRIVKGLNRNT